jgi:hypothetical protein
MQTLIKKLRRLAPLRFKKINPIRLIDLGGLVSMPIGYLPTNPAITEFMNTLVICVRGVNYKLGNVGHLHYEFTTGLDFESRNRVAVLDSSFEDARPLNQISTELDNVHDIKLFSDQGKLCAIGSRTQQDGSSEVVIFVFSRDFNVESIKVIASPFNRSIEKNWLPFCRGENLYILYSFSPKIILSMNPARSAVAPITPSPNARKLDFLISGSTPGLELKGEYLFGAHRRSVRLPSRRRVYLNRLYVLEESTGKLRAGPWFSIGEPTIQFLNGMVLREKEALISFGEMDRRAWLAIFDRECFLRELYPAR